MDHYQYLFKNITNEQNDILIAMLSNIGFSGFEEDDNNLKAIINAEVLNEREFANVIEQVNINYDRSIIATINWNKEWESGFSPVILLDPITHQPFASVRANFHDRISGVLHDLIITPKMSFGTGHHATTYLMMEQMSQLDFNGKTVIDFGTGTAVLAILAEKLGATKVIGIDNDEWSINNALENLEANNCTNITIHKTETISGKDKADVILANINLNIIISNLDDILAAANPGAAFLFSGIMIQDQNKILKALSEKNIKILKCLVKDNWVFICGNI